jgi:hypothetical protein
VGAARNVLLESYQQFTQGFATSDLKTVAQLLEQLGPAIENKTENGWQGRESDAELRLIVPGAAQTTQVVWSAAPSPATINGPGGRAHATVPLLNSQQH